MKIAVIPARGGSKRIPRKNIKPFCGRPMIAWSIDTALSSGLFDRVIVSTDDAEIADVAKTYGAETPFVRPAHLSDAYTGTTPVVAHAVEWCQSQGLQPDPVCCIYATAPFLRSGDLRRGLQRLEETGAEYAFSVTAFAFPIQRAVHLTQGERVQMFQPEHFLTRSQDLVEAYHDAGQFYWGRARAWTSGTVVLSPASVPVILPRYRVQDIDTPEDWHTAALMWAALQARDDDEAS